MQNDNLKLKISKFKRLSLRGAKRRSNLLSNFVIASSPEASEDEAILIFTPRHCEEQSDEAIPIVLSRHCECRCFGTKQSLWMN